MLAGAVAATLAIPASASAGTAAQGPSSTDGPYVIPVDPSVDTTSLLTVGDSVNTDPAAPGTPYRMVGIPDGLGAYDNGDGTFTAVMNHELPPTAGRLRAHGAPGAFVSKWTIDKKTLRVLHGEDLIKQVALAPGGAYAAPAKGVVIGRLCSGNLPDQSALYNAKSGLGYPARMFMSGEEVGAEGRAFAHDLSGTSWELPYLGKFSWENAVANPGSGDKTIVVGLDDSTPGEVYVYVGQKRATGNPAERAGLTGGKLYGVRIPGIVEETDTTFPSSGSRFELVDLGDASKKTGAQLQAESTALGVTKWQRPEDGSWSPRDAREFYWVTTASMTNQSRLWRFNFDSLANPAAGGTVDLLVDGPADPTAEGPKMMDNMTVDHWGRVLVQEDPGNNPRLAKVWSYSIKKDTLTELARHDRARFSPPTAQDEESSGIIPMNDILGPGWYLFDVQWHSQKRDAELVEGGQLQALYYPPGNRG